MGNDAYIIGIGMVKFGKYLERSIKDMAGLVVEDVLQDSDLTRDDIQAAWFSNTGWGIYSFQHSIRGQVALTANGIHRIPITNVENACASGNAGLIHLCRLHPGLPGSVAHSRPYFRTAPNGSIFPNRDKLRI